jgi:hypothetical protein
MGVRVKKGFAFVAAALVTLVLAGSALAGGSLVSSYGGQAQQALVKTSSATKSAQAKQAPKQSQAKPAQAKASGTLPFTGTDVGMMLAAGGVLVLTGLVLRRTARQKS